MLTCDELVGHKPGGLGYVGVLAAMIMASLSGSAVADTAAVAALLVPMMRQRQLSGQPGGGADCLWRHIAPIIPLPFRLLSSAFPADYPSVSCLWRALPLA
ncbi:2,3-diketo-L-gulonate TRAP transporter large permease protein yiaN [Escherichia coli]|nr:2,3-diketo-L-gulonate TRAP transporter large permease protein yiaN [Escherichia coli]